MTVAGILLPSLRVPSALCHFVRPPPTIAVPLGSQLSRGQLGWGFNRGGMSGCLIRGSKCGKLPTWTTRLTKFWTTNPASPVRFVLAHRRQTASRIGDNRFGAMGMRTDDLEHSNPEVGWECRAEVVVEPPSPFPSSVPGQDTGPCPPAFAHIACPLTNPLKDTPFEFTKPRADAMSLFVSPLSHLSSCNNVPPEPLTTSIMVWATRLAIVPLKPLPSSTVQPEITLPAPFTTPEITVLPHQIVPATIPPPPPSQQRSSKNWCENGVPSWEPSQSTVVQSPTFPLRKKGWPGSASSQPHGLNRCLSVQLRTIFVAVRASALMWGGIGMKTKWGKPTFMFNLFPLPPSRPRPIRVATVWARPPKSWEAAQLPETVYDATVRGDGSIYMPNGPVTAHAGLRDVVQIINNRVLCFDPVETDGTEAFVEHGFLPPGSKRYKDKRFIFDRVFDRDATQQDVCEAMSKPLSTNVLDGFNATVFAYGKSTMKRFATSSPNLVNPRRGGLQIREDKLVEASGLTELHPASVHEVKQIVLLGNTRRTQSPTNANETSPRSHAILQVHVTQSSCTANVAEERTVAALLIIDLAGSELEELSATSPAVAASSLVSSSSHSEETHFDDTHDALIYAERAASVKTKRRRRGFGGRTKPEKAAWSSPSPRSSLHHPRSRVLPTCSTSLPLHRVVLPEQALKATGKRPCSSRMDSGFLKSNGSATSVSPLSDQCASVDAPSENVSTGGIKPTSALRVPKVRDACPDGPTKRIPAAPRSFGNKPGRRRSNIGPMGKRVRRRSSLIPQLPQDTNASITNGPKRALMESPARRSPGKPKRLSLLSARLGATGKPRRPSTLSLLGDASAVDLSV
ncbi:hypothetical protein BDM02DRAFT_3233695 [Thelephora ganbajun]|uniref:Uncharacterized protein n=1 Tax=Thelephora ganbajun TaxID=370292 RepID=A0ACB6YZN5_THEGA|nr:hypothetical protein BDM02DRAFT_3233695 [Thelephora ganbajun]